MAWLRWARMRGWGDRPRYGSASCAGSSATAPAGRPSRPSHQASSSASRSAWSLSRATSSTGGPDAATTAAATMGWAVSGQPQTRRGRPGGPAIACWK